MVARVVPLLLVVLNEKNAASELAIRAGPLCHDKVAVTRHILVLQTREIDEAEARDLRIRLLPLGLSLHRQV